MVIDTPTWVRDAVFYQVFPDRLARSHRVPQPGPLEPWDAPPTKLGFKGGDLLGVVAHLDRLAGLGITALYLNPVFASASNHRYHTDDYFRVDPLLGGDAALRELLDEAHARGMRVVLDGVFNHCGRGFWPFHHVVENGAASPYRDWFHLDAEVIEGRRSLRPYPSEAEIDAIEAMRRSGHVDGVASRRVLGYQAWWDLPALPKLNLDTPPMRAMMLDVAEHWIRFGIDGWRLDVAEEVGEDFWREFRTRVRSASPDAYLVAEIWYPKPEWLTGEHFDATMNYPLLETVVSFVAGRHLDLRAVETQATLRDRIAPLNGIAFGARIGELLTLYDPAVTAVELNMLDSHDTPRLRTMCGEDLDSVRLAMLVQMTLPGAPCLYYGTEIGMSGWGDPDCRRAFPEDPAAWVAEPHDWIADLIALRHSSRALRDGEWLLVGSQEHAVAWLRTHAEDAFVVVVNAGEEPLDWRLDVPGRWGGAEVVRLRGGRGSPHASVTGSDAGIAPPGCPRRGARRRRRPPRTLAGGVSRAPLLYFGGRVASSSGTRDRSVERVGRRPPGCPRWADGRRDASPDRDRHRPRGFGDRRVLRAAARSLRPERRVHGGGAGGHGRHARVRGGVVPRSRALGSARRPRRPGDHRRRARWPLRDRLRGLPRRGVGVRGS